MTKTFQTEKLRRVWLVNTSVSIWLAKTSISIGVETLTTNRSLLKFWLVYDYLFKS